MKKMKNLKYENMKDWKNEWLIIFKNQWLNFWISMIEIEKLVFDFFNELLLNLSIIDICHFPFFIFEN